jgi:predicted transcriptional regulator
MEESGLLKSNTQDSPSGPQRRVYGLAKSLSITVDVAPHLFKQDIVFFDLKSDKPKIPETLESLIERKKNIEAYSDWKNKIKPYANLLSDIDLKLTKIEKKRVHLLSIRNLIMRDVSMIIRKIRDANTRRVFHLALDEQDQSIRRISKSLNLREEIVQQLIQKIKKEFETGFFE